MPRLSFRYGRVHMKSSSAASAAEWSTEAAAKLPLFVVIFSLFISDLNDLCSFSSILFLLSSFSLASWSCFARFCSLRNSAARASCSAAKSGNSSLLLRFSEFTMELSFSTPAIFRTLVLSLKPTAPGSIDLVFIKLRHFV
eukprot:CAMPEP_0182524046 /NCGR_PEP_ID=MMETSP1323-20130603/1525_1 /TAXON_ID=236787 /ORGANISM="Florenciella parvula, Strain RCC1693" /LENGTH=140 /DNA_ID=CAMNT_0024732549 /DNA_START=199 /DNA_END=621 /DNA_ORIENTATION=+